MPVRIAAAILLALLCSPASAADPFVPFRLLFPGRTAPVVAAPLPPVEAPHDEALAAIELALAEAEAKAARAEEAAARAEEALRAAIPDSKSPVVAARPKAKAAKPPLQLQPRPQQSGPSCAQARRGVGMPCIAILANAHIYEAYTDEEKKHANSCLTAAERAVIKACFQ